MLLQVLEVMASTWEQYNELLEAVVQACNRTPACSSRRRHGHLVARLLHYGSTDMATIRCGLYSMTKPKHVEPIRLPASHGIRIVELAYAMFYMIDSDFLDFAISYFETV